VLYIVVEEKILDFGIEEKSRVYAMTGNLLSQTFTESGCAKND
jgi:hypothetical protein